MNQGGIEHGNEKEQNDEGLWAERSKRIIFGRFL